MTTSNDEATVVPAGSSGRATEDRVGSSGKATANPVVSSVGAIKTRDDSNNGAMEIGVAANSKTFGTDGRAGPNGVATVMTTDVENGATAAMTMMTASVIVAATGSQSITLLFRYFRDLVGADLATIDNIGVK